ncbi:hypothetical protein SY88_16405 [Clostridiales bacterium PH28_bin88]|nr:hypothetical protein SY88_16405 [Clostridiales bacterium PH28_bin88]
MNLINKTPKILIVSLAFMVMITFVGCSNNSTTNTSNTEKNTGDTSNKPTLKIAFLTDLSGGASLFGSYMNTVGRAVIEEINREGIKGFSKIEVKTYDTRTDAATYVEQVNRAKFEDKMDITWGDWVSTYIIPAVNQAQIPNVTNNPSGIKLMTDDNKFAIHVNGSSWEYGLAIAEFFKQNGVKKWAITGQGWGEGWMHGYAEGIKAGLKGTDIVNVWDKENPADQVDWTAEINAWKKLQPDAVVLPWPGDGTFSIIKQMKDSGFSPKYIIVEQLWPGDYTVTTSALDKEYLLNLIAPSFTDLESPAYKEWIKKEQDIGYLPYGNSAEIWDGLHLIKVAAEAAGPEGVKDPQKFMDALKKASFNGAMGYPIGPFRDNGTLEKVKVFLYQAVDGPPDWTNKFEHHWKKIFSFDIPKTTSYAEAVQLRPELEQRLGK